MNIIGNRTVIDNRTQEETSLNSEHGFAYRADEIDLHTLPASSCPWHWHHDVEFFFMKEGALTYHIPGMNCEFREGDVGFINTDILHMTEAVPGIPAIQHYHIFLPGMIGNPLNHTIEKNYLEPLVLNSAASILKFPSDTAQASVMREKMIKAYHAFINRPFGYEILIRNAISELWLILLENAPQDIPKANNTDLMRVKQMVRFVEDHYSDHLSLKSITGAAHIGQGEGARCFKRVLQMTPFTFLIGYRIDRAKEFLAQTGDAITEISMKCGFPSLNYFGKVFREKTGMTPSEYRQKYSVYRHYQ